MVSGLGPGSAEETLLLSPKANAFWAKCSEVASQNKVPVVEPFTEFVKALSQEPVQLHIDSSGPMGVLDSDEATRK